MSEELQNEVTKICVAALNDNDVERDVASQIKKELDITYGTTWHVIVGKNFGSYVTHEKGHFIYFYIDTFAFLVFKTA